MDDEWEEEEQLVVVELAGTLNNEFLTKGKTTCKILDIDSDRPMIQVGQYVFAGEYEDTLGTCMLFEEVSRKGKDSPELKYMCHTVKKLMMQRIFLSEKKEGESSQDVSEGGEQEITSILLSNDENGNGGEQQDDSQNAAVDMNMEDSVVE